MRQVWPNVIPALVIFCLTVFWRDAIDVALVSIFVSYAVAILLLMRPGTDALRLAPFEGAQPAYRAILFTACFLLLTAMLDIFVFLDFAWTRGENAIPAIAAGNLGGLLFLSIAAAYASRSHMPFEASDTQQEPETVEDKEVLAAIKKIMTEKSVYRDPNLNLDRLARKTGITARQISSAINRATAKNVSQYVNEYRISEACTLLTHTEKSVTEIMFDVGFQTKSNFNREFRRVTETSPLQWRETIGRAV
ncbi:MAG: AraC family transcriptional regulator [Sulfitobacter sp.]